MKWVIASLALVAACSSSGGEPAPAPAGCSLPNAITNTSTGKCGITECLGDFGNCDGDPRNGCETDLSSTPASCGACGNTCATGACARGSCWPLRTVSTDPSAHDLIASNGAVSWVSAGRVRSSVSGDLATIPDATGNGGLVAEDHGILFAANGFEISAVTSATTLASGLGRVVGLTPGNQGLAAHTDAGVSLVTYGGLTKVLAATERPASRCRIAISSDHVYWTETDTQLVRRVSILGGAVETWAERQRMTCGIIVDSVRAYWVSVDPTLTVYLSRVPLSEMPNPDWVQTATAVGLYAPGQTAWDLAQDSESVYVANGHDGTVWRVNKSSGDAQLIAGRQTGIRSIAADGASVTWARASGVVTATKP